MRFRRLAVLLAVAALAAPAVAQETPASTTAAYDALADTILAVREAELRLVASLLDGHRHAAEARSQRGDWAGAAAEIALFANEGDNGVGGVRKRLLEGGHHFNAEGEKQGAFEPGYVIVTREAKQKLLAVSAAMRQATTDDARRAAWAEFARLAGELLALD
jgi:hypothetical protein